jgi:hypothetical protein
MTDTAKQGTSKAPSPASEPRASETAAAEEETAATESAAAKAEAGQQAAEPAETAAAGEPAKPDLDETKRKFRAALERKNQAHGDNQGNNSRDGGKIHGAHGPAASRRNFRRKSG